MDGFTRRRRQHLHRAAEEKTGAARCPCRGYHVGHVYASCGGYRCRVAVWVHPAVSCRALPRCREGSGFSRKRSRVRLSHLAHGQGPVELSITAPVKKPTNCPSSDKSSWWADERMAPKKPQLPFFRERGAVGPHPHAWLKNCDSTCFFCPLSCC